jgi:hypothetical protein
MNMVMILLLICRLMCVTIPGAHIRCMHSILSFNWSVTRCGVINVYLVILLINYCINADVGVPQWNWAAINGPISRMLGLAVCHLVNYPLLIDV